MLLQVRHEPHAAPLRPALAPPLDVLPQQVKDLAVAPARGHGPVGGLEGADGGGPLAVLGLGRDGALLGLGQRPAAAAVQLLGDGVRGRGRILARLARLDVGDGFGEGGDHGFPGRGLGCWVCGRGGGGGGRGGDGGFVGRGRHFLGGPVIYVPVVLVEEHVVLRHLLLGHLGKVGVGEGGEEEVGLEGAALAALV